jgi:hypothetical protein
MVHGCMKSECREPIYGFNWSVRIDVRTPWPIQYKSLIAAKIAHARISLGAAGEYVPPFRAGYRERPSHRIFIRSRSRVDGIIVGIKGIGDVNHSFARDLAGLPADGMSYRAISPGDPTSPGGADKVPRSESHPGNHEWLSRTTEIWMVRTSLILSTAPGRVKLIAER